MGTFLIIKKSTEPTEQLTRSCFWKIRGVLASQKFATGAGVSVYEVTGDPHHVACAYISSKSVWIERLEGNTKEDLKTVCLDKDTVVMSPLSENDRLAVYSVQENSVRMTQRHAREARIKRWLGCFPCIARRLIARGRSNVVPIAFTPEKQTIYLLQDEFNWRAVENPDRTFIEVNLVTPEQKTQGELVDVLRQLKNVQQAWD